MLRIDSSFSPLPEFGHRIQQCVLTLITISDGQFSAVGTAFMIGTDGLMMTAAHVIREVLKRIPENVNAIGDADAKSGLYALYLTNQMHGNNNELCNGGLLPIERAWFSEELDIGFCWATRPIINGCPLRFPIFRLSPGIPRVGENILGFGYYGMSGEMGSETGAEIHVTYAQKTAFTQGTIIEVHQLKRDSGMLSFPCFRTNARFERGMSGGPILNQNGSVCGVICSSFPLIEDNPEYISYGSLVWPSLGTSIEVARREGAPPESMLIYDLVKSGHVLADATIANVTVEMKENGQRAVSVR